MPAEERERILHEHRSDMAALARAAKEEADTLRQQLAEAVDRIAELERELARGEQSFANDEIRQMRRTGFCPCCGAEDRGR